MQLSSTDFLLRPMRPQFRNSSASLAGRFLVGLALLAAIVPFSRPQGLVQQQSKPSAPETAHEMHRPPTSHLYMNFLLHENRLDKIAAERDARGEDGTPWRKHVQGSLGFGDTEMSTIRSTGTRLETELKDIGARAMAIVAANRQARAQAGVSGPVQPDPRLQELTKERESTIQREMENLNRDLGPTASAKLNDFIQAHYLESNSFRARLRQHPSPSYQERVQPQRLQKQEKQQTVNP